MSGTSGTTSEPRQRWRLVVARAADAPLHAQREVADEWEAALVAGGLPIARSDGEKARSRIAFGAPLPVGIAANGELIDVVLTERWPAWRLRQALDRVIPAGWRLVGAYDVWLAGPPLPGQVAAADYRVTLTGPGCGDASALARAVAAVRDAETLPRSRVKGDTTVSYDLRPLLVGVRLEAAGPPPIVVARTRFHRELGTGRPDEVVAAVAGAVGAPLEATSIVRERLLLIEDLESSS